MFTDSLFPVSFSLVDVLTQDLCRGSHGVVSPVDLSDFICCSQTHLHLHREMQKAETISVLKVIRFILKRIQTALTAHVVGKITSRHNDFPFY